MHTTINKPQRRNTSYRWVRQLHLWIGAWGALAALLYGITGLVMNHRIGDGAWPQGDSTETARVTLAIPTEAQHTRTPVPVAAPTSATRRPTDP